MTDTWIKLCRLLEQTSNLIPTTQTVLVSRQLSLFQNKENLFKLLSLDLEENNIGNAKVVKWVAKIFDLFDEEVERAVSSYGDIGSAIYFLEASKEVSSLTIKQITDILQLDCGKSSGSSFDLVKEVTLQMSDLERKWFFRFLIRKPRNNIKEGLLTKILAKHYSKKVKVVKQHLNFNSFSNIVRYYEMKEEPPCNLSHGSFVKPMLAKEVPMNKWPDNKIVDYKYDGNRYQIHKEGSNVIIFNRKGSIVTPQFQDIVEQVRQYYIDCILDGEIYPMNEDGSPAEHKLMGTRVHSKDHAKAREKVSVRWVVFDCLKIADETIMDLPYNERLEKMKNIPQQAHRMKEGEDVLAFYNRAINDGFEGIIVKDATLPYEAGKRSIGWAKYKPPRIELDVAIIGAKYGQGNKSNVFASFNIGVKSDTGFHPVGWVGTGFSDEELYDLTNSLRKNVEKFSGGIYFLLPRTVLEVSADLVSMDEKGNYGLRFPRCKRIREDKFVADCDTLDRLIKLYSE